jgi:hypothetical protein
MANSIFDAQGSGGAAIYEVQIADGSIAGVASWLEVKDTFALSGLVGIASSLVWAEPKDQIVITGVVAPAVAVTGAATWSEPADMLALAGSVANPGVSVSGSLAWLESSDILTISGTVAVVSSGVTGAIAWAESPDVISIAGAVTSLAAPITGQISWIDRADEIALQGLVYETPMGVMAWIEPTDLVAILAQNDTVLLEPNPHNTYILGGNFPPKRASEAGIYTVDFIDSLAEGEEILSAVCTVTVARGIDPDPSEMVRGTVSIQGALVSSILDDGIPGVVYYPVWTAQTSQGQTLVLPHPKCGALPVVE